MIKRDSTITVNNNVATIDNDIYLYKYDKNIQITFSIVNSKYMYDSDIVNNLVSSAQASFAQIKFKKDDDVNEIEIEFDMQATKKGAVILTIGEELTDEDTEIGDYSIQIRLLDSKKEAVLTLPPIENCIHIQQPLFDKLGTTNVVNNAIVNQALTTYAAPLKAVEDDGTFAKKTWVSKEKITTAELNRIEDGIGYNNTQVKDLKENQINLIEDDTSMEGISDSEHDTLTTTNKKIIPAINEINTQCKDIANKEYGLQFDLIEGSTTMNQLGGSFVIMNPLEHAIDCSKSGKPQLDDIYVQGKGNIILKTRDGINFEKVINVSEVYSGDNYFKRQFTLANKKHIVFNSKTEFSNVGDIELYSEDYSTRSTIGTFNNIFYGIHGIDQNPFTKTVCYAEYNVNNKDKPTTLSIYRSVYPFTTFEKTLTVNALGSDTPEIRHFHICASDPYESGKWYASSGDDENHCHLWVSTDDGVTWIKKHSSHSIRATHYYIDTTHVYWVEDNPNGGLYRMDKTTYEIETIIEKGILSGIAYNMTPTQFGFLCIFDKVAQAIDPNNAYIYLIDYNFNIHLLAKIPYTIGGSFKSRCMSPTSGYIYTDSYPNINIFKNARIARMKVIKKEL